MRTASTRLAGPATASIVTALLEALRTVARRSAFAGRPLALSEFDDHMLRDMGLGQRTAAGFRGSPQGWAIEARLTPGAPAFLGR